MGGIIEYTYGEQVGEAIFLHEVELAHKERKANFRCRCGNKFIARISKVKYGEIKGCGCLRGKSSNSRNHNIHGLRKHPIYSIWCAMKARCYNPNRTQYKDYGGRGVQVCDEWVNDFLSFYTWAISNGWQKGLQLDKDILGSGKIYSPNTCSFVTPKENSNKRASSKVIEYAGQLKTASEWSSVLGIPLSTIHSRLNRGWSEQECLNKN